MNLYINNEIQVLERFRKKKKSATFLIKKDQNLQARKNNTLVLQLGKKTKKNIEKTKETSS